MASQELPSSPPSGAHQAADLWSAGPVDRETADVEKLTVQEETSAARPWIIAAAFLTIAGLLLQNQLPIVAASMLGMSLLGAWFWSRTSLYGVEYEREFHDVSGQKGHANEIRAFLGETVSVTLRVRNRKLIPLNWLRIVDRFPADLPVHGANIRINGATNQGELSSFWMPGAFEALERDFSIECTKRGYATFGPATVETGDGFGFFERRARLESEHQLIIYPRLYTAEDLGLPAKNPFGGRASDMRLFEDPLRNAGIRNWRPGDGQKRVHWKASAKHQHLLSRVYEPSEEPQIQIVLNVATLERHWEGIVEEKHEQAVSVAGTLAYLATQQRVPVGLIANGYLPGSDQIIRLLPGRSQSQLVSILELLAAATPYASQPIEDLLIKRATDLPWGATLAVVTATTYPGLWEVLGELSHSGRKLIVFTLGDPPPRHSLASVTVSHISVLPDDTVRADIIGPMAKP